MPEPFYRNQLMKETGVLPLGCDVPWHHQQEKDQQVDPMKQPGESQPRFAIKRGEYRKNGKRVHEPEQAFGEASERAADPESEKPPAASMPSLVSDEPAENRAGNERAE